MANPDAKGAPKPPPNLRVSSDEARECDTCSYYKRGKCSMYSNLPVDDEWVCDSWEKGEPEDAEDQAEETPAEDQPKTLKDANAEARIRVRQHFRRARAS